MNDIHRNRLDRTPTLALVAVVDEKLRNLRFPSVMNRGLTAINPNPGADF